MPISTTFFSRFTLLLGGLLLAGFAARAQAPDWQTAASISTNERSSSSVKALATDSNGDVYLAGYFIGTIRLGTTTLLNPNISPAGFIARWNPASRSFVWATRAGSYTDRATTTVVEAIAVQGNDVYVTGYFRGQATFGTTTLTNSGLHDMFVTKLTNGGSFLWAQRAGGPNGVNVMPKSLAADGTNVFVGGYFSDTTATFGTTTIKNTDRYNTDLFVTKLTDAGNFVWTVSGGGIYSEYAQALAVSGPNVYLAGEFQSPIATFGSLTLANPSPFGSSDILVAKLVDEGSSARFVWAQRAGGGSSDYAHNLILSGSSLYLAGGFYSSNATFGSHTLTSLGGSDAYVCRLRDTGTAATFEWARQAGGAQDDDAHGMAVSGSKLYLSGLFRSPTVTIGAHTLINAGATNDSSDIFVACLPDASPQPTFSWAQRAGGTGNDEATSLAVRGAGIYVGGWVAPSAPFGSLLIPKQPSQFVGVFASLTDDLTTSNTAPAWGRGLALFPNPARRYTTIQLPALPGATQAAYSLLDALGRTRQTGSMGLTGAVTTHQLDVTGLAPGLYTLRIAVADQQVTRTLAVE